MGYVYKAQFWVGLWLVAVIAIATAIWHEDRFFAMSGLPIAEVSRAVRDVSYRSEDDLRWKAIGGERQVVFDGDRIATGRSSNAILDFGDGRTAHVGEDTSLGISTIRQTDGITYILTLPKGLLAIKNSSKKQAAHKNALFPIIVRTGGKDFLIEPGQEKGIAKTSRGVTEYKPERVKAMTFKKTVAPEPQIINEPLPVDVPTVVTVATPNPPPPTVADLAPTPQVQLDAAPSPVPVVGLAPKSSVEVPKPSISGSEIQITTRLAPMYFTFESFGSLGRSSITIEWKEPSNLPKGWSPALELSVGRSKKQITLPRGRKHQLAWSDFGPLRAQTARDGVPCARVLIRGGAKINGESSPQWSFQDKALETSVCSYKEASGNVPLLVAMSDLVTTGNTQDGVFAQRSQEGLQYQMVVQSASQYVALLPIMGRAKALKVTKVPGYAENGVFIAKSGRIIMQLAGPGFSPTQADQMMAFLGGDFVFKGSRSSLYDATQMSVDQLKSWVANNTQQGKKVYVHRSGSLLPISRDFLEERREVAAFVKSVASQLFVEKVEVIAFK